MVFDPISENVFMLGRYLDNSIRTSDYIKSDFYLYDTRAGNWMQICDDTSQVGGPQLVYDHQMCMDADKRTIYVFGGKILTPRSVNATGAIEPEYSGLFSYHIATNTWAQILVDCHHASASLADVMSIKSRITHCMVFHNVGLIHFKNADYITFFHIRNIENFTFMAVNEARRIWMSSSATT